MMKIMITYDLVIGDFHVKMWNYLFNFHVWLLVLSILCWIYRVSSPHTFFIFLIYDSTRKPKSFIILKNHNKNISLDWLVGTISWTFWPSFFLPSSELLCAFCALLILISHSSQSLLTASRCISRSIPWTSYPATERARRQPVSFGTGLFLSPHSDRRAASPCRPWDPVPRIFYFLLVVSLQATASRSPGTPARDTSLQMLLQNACSTCHFFLTLSDMLYWGRRRGMRSINIW
jgi:hypothetical protein